MKSAVILVLGEFIVFALWLFHLAFPIILVYGLVASCIGTVMAAHVGPVKRSDDALPPVGLGGLALDSDGGPPCDPCGYGGATPLKRIIPSGMGSDVPDRDIERKNEATVKMLHRLVEQAEQRKPKPIHVYGYTAKEVADGLALMASTMNITASTEKSGKSDASYEEPMAMYPMEMRVE